MNAYRVNLYAGQDVEQDTATVDLGSAQTFHAWCQVNAIDSFADFDRDNAVAMDIVRVDGALTAWRASGGDHFGPSGAESNVREGALTDYGRRITFRLRAFHRTDLWAFGTGIVLVP